MIGTTGSNKTFDRKTNTQQQGEHMQDGIVSALITVIGVFIANASIVAALFLWVRAEARADARHSENKLEATRALLSAIHDENRSFHATLCEIQRSKR
jgi:hypothetical protein